ncbi:Acetyl-coenzyme A carboxyl transferase alpha chain [Dissulfuribacter thermophilus]|uniref:Acetyl-coenzyme A carboxylase carboxyl transferase subunits beta/alpha n=1 Tax=Dissulfuribacter thermophilus TaxID=1156395 RepID=A0A1B9F9F9_9BACT|nr:acetyl-CoA carboxylase carboxyl transferase subunit alpha/beta [Dissulfuribacter thermophilus]OCC16548.1 Acetyl-coenzyme A carboxyl transferase alpha chain [Dissulfuribacter thermophilus]
MADTGKILSQLLERVSYLGDIKQDPTWRGLDEIQRSLLELKDSFYDIPENDLLRELERLEERLKFLEDRAAEHITPMERVNIVRSIHRFTLMDILENVYDSYTELGGEGECSVDPAIVVARAVISRRVKNKIYSHQVMVIGHEKGKGEEFRNGGSAKPWGNEKALRYMKVAETEGIPIHFYIFTPGAFPIEDFPGAAQQIARNLYVMAKLKVPMVSFISEGGSGGAEAVGLADMRLMASHGYYSVISPEGAAAIEGKIREGESLPRELVQHCAEQLKITAEDNLKLGTIDRIVQEPPLGARRDDYAFFRRLRYEMIRATDEVVLKTKSFRAFRAYALNRQKEEGKDIPDEFDVVIKWNLIGIEKERLLALRSKKYRQMGLGYFKERKPLIPAVSKAKDAISKGYYELRYGLLKHHKKSVQQILEDMSSEGSAMLKTFTEPVRSAYEFVFAEPKKPTRFKRADQTIHSSIFCQEWETYVSPLSNEDKTVSCPNAHKYGCLDLWVPDLYGEFAGVCPTCGHHFPLEYQWYLNNLFDKGSVKEFNQHIISANPLGFKGFESRLKRDVKKTKRRTAMVTFDAEIFGIKVVVAMLIGSFRNGTVGTAEGEKFVRACDKAKVTRRPFLCYVHTTGGIRIHEGTLGVVQMPKCTMAVREYIDSGGLYIVVYDNNSYAGPVASFLGCSPYQFAIRSSRIGFAGPRVIRETTGQDVPPDYHNAKNALKRGHIQGIWDRRMFRKNLFEALLSMGGPKLYYR